MQLLIEKDKGIRSEKVVENNENDLTDLTAPPNDESGGENAINGPEPTASFREARRISQSLRFEYRNGYVVQPDPTNLSIWRVGKNLGGTIRWLDQHGTREWAVGEVKRRLGPQAHASNRR